jgi:hypothetical protein
MVNAVSAVSGAQTSTQNTNVQSAAPATPAAAPPPSISSIDFVVSGIYVNNLQNVAILEYRSSQTDQVIQQYPDQAQIDAFKAAQQLAEQANLRQQQSAAAHAAAVESDETLGKTAPAVHVSAPAITTSAPSQSSGSAADSGSAATGSSGGSSKTSVIA